MAKKKKAVKKTLPRKGDVLIGDIDRQVEEMEELVAALGAAKDTIGNAGMDGVTMDGISKFVRGKSLIGEYVDSLNYYIARAMREQD